MKVQKHGGKDFVLLERGQLRIAKLSLACRYLCS